MGTLDSAASLQTILKSIQTGSKHVDSLVLSGDLSEDGSTASYRRLKEILSPIDCPMDCMPGNHDDPKTLTEELVGGDIGQRRAFQIPGWQIVLLNSHVTNQTAGRLSSDELAFLDTTLGDARSLAGLVFLHHPPVSIGSPWMDAMGLLEPEAFRQTVAGHPQIRIVAFGHIHQAFDVSRYGVRWLGVPSTCVQFTPQAHEHLRDPLPPGFRWFELYPDGSYRTGIKRVHLDQ